MQRAKESAAVEPGPCGVVERGNEVAFAGGPELGESRFDGRGLTGVPGAGTGIAESVGELSAFNECAVLDHEGEEVDALDFFPEIEAGGLPIVGDVLQVGLDDGVGGEAAVVEGGGDVGLLPGVQHHVCKLDEDGRADGGAVELRTAPVPGKGTAADEELGLADAPGGVGAAGVASLLQLVVRGGIGLE